MRTMVTTENFVQIIISDIDHTVYIRLTVFLNFSKLLFVLNHFAFTKFPLRWCTPCLLLWTLFKSSFPTLHALCLSHLQRFENYRNYSLFCTFWLLRNLYSGDAHHANCGERSSNHHFRHCAPSYITFKVFWNFSKLLFVLHILAFAKFQLRWCAPRYLWWTLFKSSFLTLPTLCISPLQCFETFRNCCLLCTFWFLEASTPMMRTMVTMVNIVQIITSDVEHTMYITFKAFWKLSKLQFVLHILAFTKFLLRWRAPC